MKKRPTIEYQYGRLKTPDNAFGVREARVSFADKFLEYNKSGLWNYDLANTPQNIEALEIISLLQKVKELHEKVNDTAAEGSELNDKNLPFFSIVSKGKDSADNTLILEIIPSGHGGFIEMDKALVRMEKMVHLLGLLRKSRKKYWKIYEFLKFLSAYLQRQLFPGEEDPRPLSFDADAALEVVDGVHVRPSQALIHKHLNRVRQKFGSGPVGINVRRGGLHSATTREVLSVKSEMQSELREKIKENDHPSMVQAATKKDVEKYIFRVPETLKKSDDKK